MTVNINIYEDEEKACISLHLCAKQDLIVNGYTFRGCKAAFFNLPALLMGSTLKGKNLLP